MGGILDAFKLDGKVAVVTGANRGIGRGIALGLAQAGADILGVSRDDSAPETRQLVDAAGGRYVHCAADLGDMASLARVVPAAREAYGRIDILVNNAGIIRRNDSLDFSEQDWDQVMDVNLKATFFLSRDVARFFVEQGSGGKIINIASMLSFQGGIRVPSYTASKSGVKGLTMLLANEWAAKGINVNAIAPGLYRHRQYPGPAGRSGTQRRDSREDPSRPLGRPWGPGRCGGVPGFSCLGLYAGLYHGGGRRLAGPVKNSRERKRDRAGFSQD
jgi:2-deoxy-D-gluconate 3-dehydrogenase